MSWYGKRMRNLDGRTGHICHEGEGFGHVGLQIEVDPSPMYKDDPTEKAWVQLNSFGSDSGEIGWFWWSKEFMGEGGWLLLGDHNPECVRSSDRGKMTHFTPDNLMALSEQARVTYTRFLEQHPPGTVHGGRNLAYARMVQMQICANWMRAKGLHSLTHVAHLGDLPAKGQKVRLPVGAVVKSWGGAQPISEEALTRRQTVVVAWVEAGSADDRNSDAPDAGVRQAVINWSGAGQRFRSAEVVGLEILE